MKAILTYHSIDESRSPISISPAQFDAHRRWFSSCKVRIVSTEELISLPDDEDDAAAITFDDGFKNILEPVTSMLVEGMPVTLLVVSRHVGGTNAWRGHGDRGVPTLPLLSWSELDQLRHLGASIEAHTRTHPRLSAVSDTELDDELAGAQSDVRERLGVPCNHVAYPYGDVNERIVRRARQYYRFGHTTIFGGLGASRDPMWLPRLDMYYFRGPRRLEAWGTVGFKTYLKQVQGRRFIRRLLG